VWRTGFMPLSDGISESSPLLEKLLVSAYYEAPLPEPSYDGWAS
jgi:hypothetical protein